MYRYNLSLASILPLDYRRVARGRIISLLNAILVPEWGMGIAMSGYRTHLSCSGIDECRYYYSEKKIF